MKERSFSYEAVARALNVSFQTVYRWLSGGYKPSNLALIQLRKFIKKYENHGPLTR
ncbi:MAG: helix-turn-helix transcriptional regulator [Desulfobacteraceae bacterium]|nr:helix-turn-helix transcriptional regulator [Desulfobacteraceae bacterium]